MLYPESQCMHTSSRCPRSLRPHSSQKIGSLASSSLSSIFLCVLTLICGGKTNKQTNKFKNGSATSAIHTRYIQILCGGLPAHTVHDHLFLNVPSRTPSLVNEGKSDPIHWAGVGRLRIGTEWNWVSVSKKNIFPGMSCSLDKITFLQFDSHVVHGKGGIM